MWKVSVFITLCCVFIGTAHAASIDCNIDECRKPMKIYEELGCKPIYGSKSCCPKRFECPDDMKVVKDENKCTFEGNDYKIGEVLPRNLTTESKCVEECICSRYEEEPAKFLCTNSDCGISSFKVPGCINIYGDLNECCSTSIVCDDEEKEKLATCWDSDVEYHEGEKFISKSNPCYECLCHKDFDNTTIIEKNSHCHKLNCEIELKYKSFIQRGCLPIFENDKCCPVDWKCFDSTKKNKKVVKRSPYYDDEDSSEEHNSSENSKEHDDDDDDDDEEETDETKISHAADSAKVTPLEVTQFLPPFEDEKEPTLVKSDESVKEITPQSSTTEKAVQDEEEEKQTETTQKPSEETTLSSSSDEIATLPVTEASAVSESITEAVTESTTIKVENTEAVTEAESTTLSTESTTVTTEKATKDESSEESDEDNSDEAKDEATSDLKKADDEAGELSTSESSSTEVDSDITTQAATTSTEAVTESSTQSTSSSTEAVTESATESTSKIVSESSPESIPEISEEEQTTAAAVENDSSKSLDQLDEAVTEVPEVTTSSLPEEPKTSTEAIKVSEEAKTTEATVKIAEEQELTPPVPTQIDMILTTLKELKDYVSKLSMLQTTRTSETEPPASFVNFTVSRSLPITENNEETSGEAGIDVRSIRKRSVEQKSVYIKFSNKEKGCTVGTQLYRIGEEIKTDDKCIACFCNYSPIGHCLRNEKCKTT
ncbi:uncharacterized protein [Chironomus tepperi]|uniref:uncharacterized protein isoform X2 n=1 Tax=Chironomus tepperi TaxID=113505 RepID=UPI00391FBF71